MFHHLIFNVYCLFTVPELFCRDVSHASILQCPSWILFALTSWSAWSVNCSDSYVQQLASPPEVVRFWIWRPDRYIFPIPNETAVQAWAYLPLSNDTFDLHAAMYNKSVLWFSIWGFFTYWGVSPLGPGSTASVPLSTTSMSSIASSSTLSFSSSEGVSHKSSHVGAIAHIGVSHL